MLVLVGDTVSIYWGADNADFRSAQRLGLETFGIFLNLQKPSTNILAGVDDIQSVAHLFGWGLGV